jgi:hypothetical protein
MIEAIFITGMSVVVLAVLVVMMTRPTANPGNGSRIRPPISVFTPRVIR